MRRLLLLAVAVTASCSSRTTAPARATTAPPRFGDALRDGETFVLTNGEGDVLRVTVLSATSDERGREVELEWSNPAVSAPRRLLIAADGAQLRDLDRDELTPYQPDRHAWYGPAGELAFVTDHALCIGMGPAPDETGDCADICEGRLCFANPGGAIVEVSGMWAPGGGLYTARPPAQPGDDAIQCEAGTSAYTPGCGDHADFAAGCYAPCGDQGACPAGTTCRAATINPCADSDCEACGAETMLCM